MTIKLYTSTAETDKVNKGSDLTLVATLTGTLRESTDVIDPSIDIEQTTLPSFNYFQVEEFGRYYFLTDLVSIANGIWRIKGHVDVLYSFATGIMGFQCKVSRNENDYDLMLPDNRRIVEDKPNLTITQTSTVTNFFSVPTTLDEWNGFKGFIMHSMK